MGSRQQIQEIPDALRIALEKARAEYGQLTRKVRWGDGPVFVSGVGNCSGLAAAGECAFEAHLGLPVVARPAEFFLNYDLDLFRPRSVLMLICTSGESLEAQDLAAVARQRGCTLVVLTNAFESALAKSAEYVFTVHVGGNGDSPAAAVCMQAALNFLSFETMRALKKPMPWWESVARDFAQLPEKLEWTFTQLGTAVHSLASELAGGSGFSIAGGGFLRYPAWHAAGRMSQSLGVPIEAVEISDLLSKAGHSPHFSKALLFLSGSHSKLKKLVHRCAVQAHSDSARLISLTDANDRALAEASDFGILIPELQEAPSSTLVLFMLEWLAMELSRTAKSEHSTPASR